jgi:hypothetical protein
MEDKGKDALLAFWSKVNQELAKAGDTWMGWWTLWLRLRRLGVSITTFVNELKYNYLEIKV